MPSSPCHRYGDRGCINSFGYPEAFLQFEVQAPAKPSYTGYGTRRNGYAGASVSPVQNGDHALPRCFQTGRAFYRDSAGVGCRTGSYHREEESLTNGLYR